MSLIDGLGEQLPFGSEQRRKEIKALVHKAGQLIQGKLFKLALVTLDKAYQIDGEITAKEIQPLIKRYSGGSHEEAYLSLGLILLRHDPQDFKLANQLGNAARRQESYTQAESLYRHALKIEPKLKVAYYNLAACRAKAEVYDGQVQDLLRKHFNFTRFALPLPKEGVGSLDEIKEEIKTKKTLLKKQKLEDLEATRQKKAHALDLLALHGVDREIKETEKAPLAANLEDIRSYVQGYVESLKNGDEEEEKTHILIHDALYNLIIYALAEENWEMAIAAQEELIEEGSQEEFLPMFRALCHSGQEEVNEAGRIMTELLGPDPYNRYYNINLALIYRDQGNDLIYLKYAILSASLLAKSEGIYRREEIYQKALSHYEAGKLDPALPLFELVSQEEENPLALWYLAEIHLQKNHRTEGVAALQEILAINPHSDLALKKLQEIQGEYSTKGEEALEEHKYKTACQQFEKALAINRSKEALQNAIRAYHLLKEGEKAGELQLELEELKEQARLQEREQTRQEYIRQGTKFFKRKAYYQAIQQFENAFRMKVDKSIFLYLSNLYKQLHKKEELKDLVRRWKEMLDYEEKWRAAQRADSRAKVAGQGGLISTKDLMSQYGIGKPNGVTEAPRAEAPKPEAPKEETKGKD